MRFPYDEWELKDRLQSLEIALLRSGGTRRRIPSPEEHTVQDFGRGLFESLLVGDVRTRYEMSLSEARRQGKGLRLKLRIQPSELAVLPWEFLYDAERDRYPSLSSNTPLVRYLDLPQPVEPLRVSPPLRVLGMVTSPLGLDPLDVEHEKRLVEEAIRGLRERSLLELTWLEGQTWRHLQRAMRRGPWHIFHFVGHGGFDAATEEGAIALSNDAGHMHLLRATGLAELLDDHYPLRLVFLNSCEGARGSESDAFSSTAATLVRRGVPAVVAMQYEITDRAAIEFSRDFYEALADSLPVDAAVTEARAAVSMDSMLEWGTPVLYMHSPDGRVFDISTPAPRPHPTPETEDRQEEDSLRWYREAVESAWAEGKLPTDEVQWLRHLANDELRLSPNAAADIEREVTGDTIETILERQEEAARQEERNRRLEELYTQARRLHRDRNWQAVIDLFEQINSEDPNYSDPEGLLASSSAALELEQRVATLYDRGQRHIGAEEWQQALECLEEVQLLEPGYRETEELLSQVRQELALPSTVTVPNLGGQEVPQARGTLANSNLKLGRQHVAPSDTISEGQIIEQSPEAGTEVEADSSVSVTISLGSQTATAADSLSQGVTESEHAEPPPSSHQPGQPDSGPERVGPRTWQKDRMVGQSIDRTERVQPDYSTDTEQQPPLPMLGRIWWALALGGLIIVILGLVVYWIWQVVIWGSSGDVPRPFRLLGSTLLIANGVFTILASSTAHTRLLLRTQGMASILAGLVAFLSSWADGNLSLVVHYASFDSWGLSLGIIQIVAAMRFGWAFRVMRLMVVSGASLVIYSMYGFYSLSQWDLPTPWLLAIWLLASGILLVVFAFRVRQWEAAEVEG
jgi:hypothetical protein